MATISSAIKVVKQRHVISYETKPLDLDHVMLLINQIIDRRKIEEALLQFKHAELAKYINDL